MKNILTLCQRWLGAAAGCDGTEFNYKLWAGIKIGFTSNKGGVDGKIV